MEKLHTRLAVPAPSAHPAMGAAARTTSATKVLLGAWGTPGVGDKAGENMGKLLIRTSHSFVPLLISHVNILLLGQVENHQPLKTRIPELLIKLELEFSTFSWWKQRAWTGRSSSELPWVWDRSCREC